MISKGHSKLSIVKQCLLLSVYRSVFYYKIRGESALNLELMRLMDAHYLEHPYKGARRMHVWLTKDKGYKASYRRIERLYYRVMGLRAVMPGPHTSKRCKEHKTYPYLLNRLIIDRPSQVWATDITYIPMKRGYMYLVAIIDLYSRYVVNWSLSNSMTSQWCKQTLQEAIEMYGRPEIINTDQGAQFTSEEFSEYVLSQDIRLSMDGKGRAIDNAFIERFWRSVKYEKLYLNPAENGTALYFQLADYMEYYNHERRHSGIDDQVPVAMFENDKLNTKAA
ncbi:MAG: IS3 family transposase [Bacteroidetes bacterium]|nr:IS3 family transposase [Bacteroidota bacterium]